MAEKPSQNKKIEIDYRLFHELEKEAIDNDETIKKVAEERFRNETNEELNHLKEEKEKLENEIQDLKQKNRRLKQKKEPQKQDGNWESIDKERLVDLLLDLDGVGEQTAYKVAAKLMATDWWRIQFNKEIFKEWKE